MHKQQKDCYYTKMVISNLSKDCHVCCAKLSQNVLVHTSIIEDIIAINKPAGLAVHGGPGLLNDLSRHLYLWEYGGDTPHLAHRLDK